MGCGRIGGIGLVIPGEPSPPLALQVCELTPRQASSLPASHGRRIEDSEREILYTGSLRRVDSDLGLASTDT